MDDELRKALTGDKPAPLAVVKVLAETTIEAVADLRKRIAALEAATAEVQTRGIRYRGVHQRALDYRVGDVVTAKGCLWAALRPTEQMPGESGDWQLIVRGARNES